MTPRRGARWSEVNLTGTFLVTQDAIPLLKEAGADTIVTMSSLAGRSGYPNRVAFSITKWGLVGFAKTLAMELGPFGITSNTIHPGAVEGPRIAEVLSGRAAASGRTVEEERGSALANQSVKQFIDPADIAALVLFLAGPHGRSISGQVLPVDGVSKAAHESGTSTGRMCGDCARLRCWIRRGAGLPVGAGTRHPRPNSGTTRRSCTRSSIVSRRRSRRRAPRCLLLRRRRPVRRGIGRG